MKQIQALCLALLAFTFTHAQLKGPLLKSGPFPKAIEAVLHDFPNNLRNLNGELILSLAEIDNYESLVKMPGSIECSITRYHSVEDTLASWQAKMFQGEEFNVAAQRYTELYRQLKSCYLRLVDGSIVYLNCSYDAPKEENDFVTSTLRLDTGDWHYKEVKIELELVYQFPEWIVNINVVNKKKDTLEGYGSGN
ncbi:MAG: hypothetical protein H7Y27_02585 [Gemmatimonadaceae bacterium]|nr:hypothetical protein [Chitinophagaceae bacterium]